MTYLISFSKENNYILDVHYGSEDFYSLKKSIVDILIELSKHNCWKVLSDYSNANLSVSTLEMIHLEKIVDDQAEEIGLLSSKIKRALVRKNITENIGNYNFFETYSVNRAQRVKVFDEFEDAINWLNNQ